MCIRDRFIGRMFHSIYCLTDIMDFLTFHTSKMHLQGVIKSLPVLQDVYKRQVFNLFVKTVLTRLWNSLQSILLQVAS